MRLEIEGGIVQFCHVGSGSWKWGEGGHLARSNWRSDAASSALLNASVTSAELVMETRMMVAIMIVQFQQQQRELHAHRLVRASSWALRALASRNLMQSVRVWFMVPSFG